MSGLYCEDSEVGQQFRHALSRTVTKMDNTMFSLLTLNSQPLHIDAHFTASSEIVREEPGLQLGMSRSWRMNWTRVWRSRSASQRMSRRKILSGDPARV